jgi:hypothetical protein
MKNVQIYADRIAGTIDRYADQPKNQMKQFLHLLNDEGLDTSQPILYGYDAVQRIFWFRNDVRGEIVTLPLHKVKVWPERLQVSVAP